MQIKSAVRYHYKSTRRDTNYKDVRFKCCQGRGLGGTLSHCLWDSETVGPLWGPMAASHKAGRLPHRRVISAKPQHSDQMTQCLAPSHSEVLPLPGNPSTLEPSSFMWDCLRRLYPWSLSIACMISPNECKGRQFVSYLTIFEPRIGYLG